MPRNPALPPPLPPMPGFNAPEPPEPRLPAQPPMKPPPKPHGHWIFARAVFGLAMIALMAGGGAWLMNASIDPAVELESQGTATRHELLVGIRSWGYQLQKLDPVTAARSPHDLLVIDEAFDGADGTARRDVKLRALKRKPDGSRRLVLAYLSIGEAEDYRAYWNRSWVKPSLAAKPAKPAASDFSAITPALAGAMPGKAASAAPLRVPTAAAPVWLGDENPSWRGNYRVRYWEEGWQAHLLGTETAALERIIAAGFDGVYLDRADAYQSSLQQHPQARADMETLIERISARGRELSPGFIVALQNAEELLTEPRVRNALDAVAKEDLLYGIDGDGRSNGERDIAASTGHLTKALRHGLPVLVVEYLADENLMAAARQRIDTLGFIPYFAPRALDGLSNRR